MRHLSVIIATLIGIPIGILGARNPTANRAITAVIDTLQTLPSFVYLIPVVMLFRVGDFSAMVAVVVYALPPAIRYTAHGIARVDPALIEAAKTSGCTRRQILWKVQLPLAWPEIMLGLNQTIMLALSMLVITALVGTRDLGQEVYIALTKADTGRGIVAGALRRLHRHDLGPSDRGRRATPQTGPGPGLGLRSNKKRKSRLSMTEAAKSALEPFRGSAGRRSCPAGKGRWTRGPLKAASPTSTSWSPTAIPDTSCAVGSDIPVHGIMRFNELAAATRRRCLAGISPA